jgi:hypothetical protein
LAGMGAPCVKAEVESSILTAPAFPCGADFSSREQETTRNAIVRAVKEIWKKALLGIMRTPPFEKDEPGGTYPVLVKWETNWTSTANRKLMHAKSASPYAIPDSPG